VVEEVRVELSVQAGKIDQVWMSGVLWMQLTFLDGRSDDQRGGRGLCGRVEECSFRLER
jgi:hypothetical protein